MGSYILRRLALIIPTLLGIMLLNFVIVQAAPGGPVEQLIAETEGHGGSAFPGPAAVVPAARLPPQVATAAAPVACRKSCSKK